MIIDITRDNLYCSIKDSEFFIDKTYYIKALDKEIEKHPFISFVAPNGLGVSTFVDMLATFYDFRYPQKLFENTDIYHCHELMAKRNGFISLVYDFNGINLNSSYNDVIMEMCAQTAVAIKAIFPNISSLPRNDIIKQFRTIYSVTGKQPVIIFKNLDNFILNVTQTRNLLISWSRLCTQLYDLCYRDNVIYALFTSSHMPNTVNNLRDPDLANQQYLFFDISDPNHEVYDSLCGWCGLTFEELETLLANNYSELSSDEIYDWCGHYVGGSMRFESAFKAIQENDLFLTIDVKPAVDYARTVLNDGFGFYLLSGDMGVARLLTNNELTNSSLNVYDPRISAQKNRELYSFSRRFLERLSSYGILSLVRVSNQPVDTAQLVNKEVSFAISDEIAQVDDFLNKISKIASDINMLEDDLEAKQGNVFKDHLFRYIEAQRQFNINSKLCSLWQIVRDLLTGVSNYTVIPFRNYFLLKHVSIPNSFIVITVSLNVDIYDSINDVASLRQCDIQFMQSVNGYKGKIPALIYNVNYDPKEPNNLSISYNSIYVV
ncbi:MAG: AAA family ATPase [Succinivibrionaceae bacterium]